MINTCYISQSVLLNLAWMMLQWVSQISPYANMWLNFHLFSPLPAKNNWKISSDEERKHTTGNKAFKFSQTVVELYCLLVRIERGMYCISRIVQLQQHVWNVYDLSARSSVVKVQRSLTFVKKTRVELSFFFAAGEGEPELWSYSPSSRMSSLSA